MPDVALGIFIFLSLPIVPMGYLKNFGQFGSAVWSAIANIYKYIYMNEKLYYIDLYFIITKEFLEFYFPK